MDKTHTILHGVVFLNVVVVVVEVEDASVARLRSCQLQTQLMQLKIAEGVDNVLIPIIQQVGS
jgi:hypothetical protein